MTTEYIPAQAPHPSAHASQQGPIELGELLAPLRREWKLWLGTSVLVGALGVAGSYLIKPEFTSTTSFLPPQQQQNGAAAALASLGSLAGLSGGTKSPADQYIVLMQRVTIGDRLVDQFHLLTVYDEKFRVKARKELANRTEITLGKKDGIIDVAVTDTDPQRAAAIANQYVEELRRMTSTLAVTEAQQRRMFFERQMQDVKAKLTAAQTVLQASGINSGDIQTAPQAAAEQYAKLRAQATAADIQMQTLRTTLAESAAEVRQQAVLSQALHAKLAQLEESTKVDASTPDYVTKYREFKYQEALFDIMSKQYELARVDESREGALIQVVDVAKPAELKSKPKRAFIGIAAAFACAMVMAVWLIVRDRRRQARPA
jgi:uncharacterized protein involved in exopolysaccharide biosynthesis